MPISEKKLAANRANAMKSTGPKSSRNSAVKALNCAALADSVLIEGESRPRLIDLVKSQEAEFRPGTPTEPILVSNITTALSSVSSVFGHRAVLNSESHQPIENTGHMENA
jgi:hypothetical protein